MIDYLKSVQNSIANFRSHMIYCLIFYILHCNFQKTLKAIKDRHITQNIKAYCACFKDQKTLKAIKDRHITQNIKAYCACFKDQLGNLSHCFVQPIKFVIACLCSSTTEILNIPYQFIILLTVLLFSTFMPDGNKRSHTLIQSSC